MDGDCGYVAAADRVIAPVVRAALHGDCAVVVSGQQGIGCECVQWCGDHHCWRVSDGADVRIGRNGCAFRPIRKLVSSDTRRPRWSAAAWRYPPASPRYPPASPGCAPGGVGGLLRLAGTMAVGRSWGLDVNGMGSAVRGMGSAVRGMGSAVRGMGSAVRGMCSAACGMCSAVRGMCLAACLVDWGKQKSSSEELLLMGGRWDSNPRHSEPQSDALTN